MQGSEVSGVQSLSSARFLNAAALFDYCCHYSGSE